MMTAPVAMAATAVPTVMALYDIYDGGEEWRFRLGTSAWQSNGTRKQATFTHPDAAVLSSATSSLVADSPIDME